MQTLKWLDDEQTIALFDDGEGKRISIPAGHPMLAQLIENGLEISDHIAIPAPLARLPKLLVIDRLQQAGKFAAALAALTKDALIYERWSASNTVNVEDAEVLGLLAAIGADASVILGPE